MIAGDTGEHRMDLAAGHQLRFLDGSLDRLHGGLDIDHHAFFKAARRVRADTHDLQGAVCADLTDQRDHLGGPDIKPDNHSATLLACHKTPSLSV